MTVFEVEETESSRLWCRAEIREVIGEKRNMYIMLYDGNRKQVIITFVSETQSQRSGLGTQSISICFKMNTLKKF